MSKKFNIHDWHYKQSLTEHTVTFTKDEMSTLHKDGKLVKADDEGKDHTYIYNELDEANTTGTGASFSAGDSPAFATPHAFAKKNKWKNKNTIYREQEEEEELSKDVKVLEKLLSDRINT